MDGELHILTDVKGNTMHASFERVSSSVYIITAWRGTSLNLFIRAVYYKGSISGLGSKKYGESIKYTINKLESQKGK